VNVDRGEGTAKGRKSLKRSIFWKIEREGISEIDSSALRGVSLIITASW